MKIERLSDKQIRCTLTRSDLTERGLRLSELAYGTDKARELFREMMDQAWNLYGFEAENSPLMIEAMPMESGSVVLIVTRVDNPEDVAELYGGAPAAESQESARGLRPQDIKAYQSFLMTHRLYTFPSVAQAARAARQVASAYTGESALYLDEETHIYYLFLSMRDADEASAMQPCLAALSEYGGASMSPYARLEFVREHGRTILADDAIATLSVL